MESCYSFISAWLIDAHEEATFTPHLASLRARRIQSHGEDRASIWTGVSHGDARVRGTTEGRHALGVCGSAKFAVNFFPPLQSPIAYLYLYIYTYIAYIYIKIVKFDKNDRIKAKLWRNVLLFRRQQEAMQSVNEGALTPEVTHVGGKEKKKKKQSDTAKEILLATAWVKIAHWWCDAIN